MKASTGGYSPSHFANLVQVEDRHFWFRARNHIIAQVAARAVAPLRRGYRVLEVGCGDGNVLRVLRRACPGGTVVGMDLLAEGLRYARRRSGCALVQGDAARSPFGKPFQLIGLFDVLEHLPDDRAALRDAWRLLDDPGTLLVTVPANPRLWSEFDEASGHCRRYRRDELVRTLEETGFRVHYVTPFMAAIYPLVWLRRRRPGAGGRARGASAVHRELRVIPVLNELILFVLMHEARWIGWGRALPLGTSLLVVAGKNGGLAG